MTAFWDKLERDARESFEQAIEIERHAREVTFLIMGDREFPDEFREKIWETTVKYGLETIGVENGKCQTVLNDKNVQWYQMMRTSRLLSELHSLWHNIARNRTRTRFGVISDDPSGALRLRDLWTDDPERQELWRQLKEEALT
jgi:hypothetical protein